MTPEERECCPTCHNKGAVISPDHPRGQDWVPCPNDAWHNRVTSRPLPEEQEKP